MEQKYSELSPGKKGEFLVSSNLKQGGGELFFDRDLLDPSLHRYACQIHDSYYNIVL